MKITVWVGEIEYKYAQTVKVAVQVEVFNDRRNHKSKRNGKIFCSKCTPNSAEQIAILQKAIAEIESIDAISGEIISEILREERDRHTFGTQTRRIN